MTATPRADAVRAWIDGGRVGPIDWPEADTYRPQPQPFSWRTPLSDGAWARITRQLARFTLRSVPHTDTPVERRGVMIGGRLVPPPPRRSSSQ